MWSQFRLRTHGLTGATLKPLPSQRSLYTSDQPSSLNRFQRVHNNPNAANANVSVVPVVNVKPKTYLHSWMGEASSLGKYSRVRSKGEMTRTASHQCPTFIAHIMPSANITLHSSLCLLPLLGFVSAYAVYVMPLL
jgi:hypothetical protein